MLQHEYLAWHPTADMGCPQSWQTSLEKASSTPTTLAMTPAMMILDAAWMSSDLARGSVQDLDFPFVARSHAAASSPLPTFQAVLIQIHKLITIQHV
jgi:hypothetical protein